MKKPPCVVFEHVVGYCFLRAEASYWGGVWTFLVYYG